MATITSNTFDVSVLSGQLSSLVDTPEQASLHLPGSFGVNDYATVRYKVSSESTWEDGHPMYHIRPGEAEDAFGGCLFGLTPGEMYDVEVSVNGSGPYLSEVTTRSLPLYATTPDAAPSSISALQTAINAASPGDIIELQDGSYTLTSDLDIGVSGGSASPIYIRGESQSGVTVNIGGNSIVVDANHIVFENMTLVGDRAANSTSTHKAIKMAAGVGSVEGVTIRDIIASNITRAVASDGGTSGNYSHNCNIYNNQFTGVLAWDSTRLNSSTYWNNDGIRVVGYGNCVWNNTLEGFSDAITFAHSVDESSFKIQANFAYRNFIRNCTNDVLELDHCERFIGVYDNYCENMHTGISQSDNGSVRNYGPTYVFRNIFVNIATNFVKLNDSWQGWHHYNNTYVLTDSETGVSREGYGFYDASAVGNQDRFAYRNNVHIYRGTKSPQYLWRTTWKYGSSGLDEYDFGDNGYYPGTYDVYMVSEIGPYADHAAAVSAGVTHTQLYPSGAGLGTANQIWSSSDVITVSNPFANTLTLGSDPTTEVTGMTSLSLSPGDGLKNAGVEIPGITNGYSGAAPDMGAVIEGRTAVAYGHTAAAYGALGTLANSMSSGDSENFTKGGVANLQSLFTPDWRTGDLNWQAQFMFDPSNREVHLFGDAQSTLAPNDKLRHARYDLATDAWTAVDDMITSQVGHVYGDNAINLDTGDVYFYSWNENYVRGCPRSTSTWGSATSSDALLSPVAGQNGNGLAWHPTLYGVGGLIQCNKERIMAWNSNTDSWANLLELAAADDDVAYGMGVYSAYHDKVFVGGGTGSGPLYSVDAGGTVVRLGTPPLPTAGFENTTSQGTLMVDPTDSSRLMIVGKGTASSWHTSTDGISWTQQGSTNPLSSMLTLCAIPDLGVVWGLNLSSSIVWKP